MPPRAIEQILEQLTSHDADQAWSDFLEEYSTAVYQVICHFEPDPDKAADCFQFVCEQLVKNRFQRLRKFKIEGTAKFSTWLRAVVRNLCIDWHRKETGRPRPFKSIAKLSAFDQQVFQLLYERGVSADEGLRLLSPAYPNVTEENLAQSRRRIETGLTRQQRWLLNTRAARSQEASFAVDLEEIHASVPDPRANPEAEAVIRERYRHLMKKLKRLSDQDRLIVHLRFEQDLTLDEIARLLQLGNAQRVDRQIKQILSQLREEST
ncbi:MAG TPA: sigma-70 family RNA polymerase sigma factor [Pyrinomonadaceae bacterium]|nr:sigma-70 family RNA polymerase sigma factor [Pyrinomonadaceae bacterium]